MQQTTLSVLWTGWAWDLVRMEIVRISLASRPDRWYCSQSEIPGRKPVPQHCGNGSILTAGNSGKVPPGQIKGGGTGGDGSEKFQYFYHPDHLGSTSYITDASGEVYQHLEYFAFGETFVEEHSNTHRTPYLFNGKELDSLPRSIAGRRQDCIDYGARYHDEQTSVW